MPTGLTSPANMFDKLRLMIFSTCSISISVQLLHFVVFSHFLEKGLIGNCLNCLNLQMTGLPTMQHISMKYKSQILSSF